jgi:signal transduction histidine kinase
VSSNEPVTSAPTPAELELMMQSFSAISGDLLESYERLQVRAERMEQELCIANRELERQVAEVEAILQALPVGVAVRNADGSVQAVNGALARILGRSADSLADQDASAALPSAEVAGEAIRYAHPDGETRVLAWRTAPIAADGVELGSVEIFDDQTELAALESRIRQMDKMAALGNMAAGIAHEIRNPMNAVKGFADLFRRQMEPGTKDHRWATLISEGVSEVESIISSLLSFAQPEALNAETVEAEEIVSGALAAAFQRTPGGRDASEWELTTSCTAGALRGDRIKLRQALRNLVSNALDIQPEGGRVRVEVFERDDCHVFRVSDAGPGVPAELAPRLADPVFTTRAEGTGLGLSLVHTIAALHGGTFCVSSERSDLGGACFQFTIPSSQLR